MNLVEKAAEKLKASRQQSPPSPRIESATEAVPPATVPTVERLQERQQAVEAPPGSATLYHVDQLALKRAGYLPSNDEDGGRLRDELRRIKRPLLANATGKNPKAPAHANRILVTSPRPGDGKTFTTVNLAMSLAREPDFEVLLVDGDIPKCSLTKAFGLDDRPGLMDVLADEKRHPESVIVRTDMPNLSVVPVGERHALASELFGSRRMEEVLVAWGERNRRRLLVFDSSPLLATSESPVLTSHMGQVVVVVAARRTRREALDAALQFFSDTQYVGLILNMSQLPASENYYDSGYGY